jgi:DNA-binding response OmpR family regulator
MHKVLLVEDEPSILIGLEDALVADGYDVITARNGETGLQLVLQERMDLLILDIMLPKLSGWDVLRTLRQKKVRLPVILLTAKGQDEDKVKGFELGADDYVTKPFGLKELLARVKAVLKRTGKQKEELQTYRIGEVCFDFLAMDATCQKKPVDFSQRELELLRYFITRKGQVVSRADILQDVWNYETDQAPTTRSIDNYVVKLRQKIEKNPNQPTHILTLHGRGYRYED